MERIFAAYAQHLCNNYYDATITVKNDKFEFHIEDGFFIKMYILSEPYVMYHKSVETIAPSRLLWSKTHNKWIFHGYCDGTMITQYSDIICELLGEQIYISIDTLHILPKK